MKKYIYASMAAAALMAASCSNEDIAAPVSGDGNVVFTAELPVLGSRAYGDGLSATSLTAYVYSADSDTPEYLFSKEATFDGLHATVELALVTGKTYDVVFWAQAPEAPYAYSTTDRTITVSYGTGANDEKRDAFFVTEAGLKVTGPVQKTVQLKRPFAQLNVLTSDYAEALASGVEVKQTSLTMELPSTINLVDGTVGEPAEVSFILADLPTGTTTVGEKTYTYLSMNYILADADKAVTDVKVGTDFALNSELSFTAVPVQRNFRTNIYGALLTNPAIFDVEILPGFDGDNNVDMSQQVAPGVFFDEAAKTYTVVSAEGLVWLNAQTKASPAKFKGCTMKLGADIDLAGVQWTPMRLDSNSSWSTFDGDNHTVANMTVSDPDAAGFFGYAIGYIKNVKFTNATVTGNYKAGVVTGDGLCSRIDNVHVDGATVTSTPRLVNGKYDDANNVGGITGYLSAESNASVTNSSVSNAVITAYRKVGGLVGATNGAAVVTGNTVTNVKVIADMTEPDYDGAATRKPDAGEVVGTMVSANATVENNTTSNVTVTVLRIEEGTISVDSADVLAALGSIVTSGNALKGVTVKLTEDIDMENRDVIIGSWDAPFSGTFDGDGHTISNISVCSGLTPSTAPKNAGLFVARNAAFKNIKIHNAKVVGNVNAAVLAGGETYSTFNNITVTGLVTMDLCDNDGAVICGKAPLSSSDITVDVEEGSYVKCFNENPNGICNIGGVFGYIDAGSSVYSNIKSNIDVIGNHYGVGGIVGSAYAGSTWENCVATGNVTMETASQIDVYTLGGISGAWTDSGSTPLTFKNCSFTGQIKTSLNGTPYELDERYNYVGESWNAKPNTDSAIVIE